MVNPQGGRTKVMEFQQGSIIAEIYEKQDYHSDRIFYDVKFVREYETVEKEKKRGPMVQQRDLDDVIIVIVDSRRYINEQIRRSKPRNYGD